MSLLANRRVRYAGTHLVLSGLVAALVSFLVFRIWYPPPYSAIAGGLALFGLLAGVDVVLGPALTLVAASPGKPAGELRRDLIVIVLLQIAAFGYGAHTIWLARPVFLAFEIDRMRVVTAADIETASLADAPEGLRALPWFGPQLIAAIKPTDPNEQTRAVELGLAGFDLSMQPRYWRSYASESAAAWRKARPVQLLLDKYPHAAAAARELAGAAGEPLDSLRFLPLVSRQASWVTLLAGPDARVVGHLPLDGFF